MILEILRAKKDFLAQAEKYVKETRGYRVPVLEPSVTEIKFDDEEVASSR
ncbi:Uncharacterized protein BC141101_01487 [Bacillus toyonensis]|nr:Uncharacterized protein BC141101_01487 [Bacillus toyonensis]